MEYQYKVIVSNRTVYKEFEILTNMESVKLGTSSSCEFRLNPESFFDSIEIEFEKKGNEWLIVCSDTVYISKGDMRRLLSTELVHGDMLSLRYAASGDEAFELRFLIDFEAEIQKFDARIELEDGKRIMLGSASGCDIQLQSRFCDNCNIVLIKQGDILTVEKADFYYGLLCNGKQVSKEDRILESSFLMIADISIYFKDHSLYFDSNKIKSGKLLIENQKESTNWLKYPLFNRNTRLKVLLDTQPIEILDPPEKPQKPKGNIIMSLMPAIIMLAVTIVIRGFMSSSGGSYIIITVISMTMGIATTIAGIVTERKKYKKDSGERIQIYSTYIEKKKEEISSCRQRELENLNDTYLDLQKGFELVEDFSGRLFERIPKDEDFLKVYLGRGRVEAKQKIGYKKQEKYDIQDELFNVPEEIYKSFLYIENAPITVDLFTSNAVGIIGSEADLYSLFKNCILDLSIRHYYSDIQIFAFFEEDMERYQWLRLLPHMHIHNNAGRNIVCDDESKNSIFEFLYKELNRREEQGANDPYLIIMVKNEMGMKSHPISRFVNKASQLNATFLFFEAADELLPLSCDQVIHLESETKGNIVNSLDRACKAEFEFETITDYKAEYIVKKLAPIYCREVSLEGSLTKNVSLYDLLNIMGADDIDLNKVWQESQIYKSMAVPLGVKSKHEVVYLDLNEKKHGPHGLVAGTTGSGKSEILQSYILSAALKFHPYEIGFVIIDFKGGGMVNQFRDLPHLIGAITNIDGNEINRSLLSIKAELKKRQTLFAESGVNHVDAYIKKFKKGEVLVPLPHLVLIVDEFAELKTDQPEFMKELISAARIGRSLGVHLILATQKPSGVVDAQIWSNSKFRLCLKVQNKEDSNEVLKTPLAAEIKEPGRAYLQVGNNEIFDLFQSAYSGASAEAAEAEMQKAFKICEVAYTGRKKLIYEKKKQAPGESAKTQLEAVVDYINSYCVKQHIERLPGICLPSLEDRIGYPEMNRNRRGLDTIVPLGIYDDPDNQRQEQAYLNITAGNTVVIGSSQYGKTNLLQVMIRGVVENYTAKEVNLYVYDFASMALKIFDELNHVGGVVLASDDEKMKNSMRMLSGEVSIRKAKLAELGITSFSAYREAGYEDMPQIIIIIDNFLALRELYPDYEDILLNILREGLSVGISVIATSLQTNGINYRFISNFSNKIALYCNQKEEYGTLFDRCRMQPKSVPGRGLIEIEKEVYEYQVYLAFEGEREIDRVNSVREFIGKWNDERKNGRAKRIPEVPKLIDRKYLKENYQTDVPYTVPMGIDYELVEWNSINFTRSVSVGITGREHFGKSTIVRTIMNYLQKAIFKFETKVYIVDDFERQLDEFSSFGIVEQYSADLNDFGTYLDVFETELNERKELVRENGIQALDELPLLLMVIQNQELFAADGISKNVAEQYKKIVKQLKQFKVSFLFADVVNAPAAFSAPEMLKAVKEFEQLIICDDLANVKLMDFPAPIMKQYKKALEIGDSYLYAAGSMKKQKNIFEEV